MPLNENEIVPGAIAYFDARVLNADARVSKSGDPVTRQGVGNQFVCYKVAATTSFWAPLTATARQERLRIDPSWVANGYGPLAAGQVHLQDGKNTYSGPHEAFVAAAQTEAIFTGGRPAVDARGVAQVLAVVTKRGGQT